MAPVATLPPIKPTFRVIVPSFDAFPPEFLVTPLLPDALTCFIPLSHLIPCRCNLVSRFPLRMYRLRYPPTERKRCMHALAPSLLSLSLTPLRPMNTRPASSAFLLRYRSIPPPTPDPTRICPHPKLFLLSHFRYRLRPLPFPFFA